MRGVVLAVILCSAVLNAHADDTSTSTSSSGSSSSPFKNKKFRENDDITDLKLKAQSGSLSRYSLHTRLNYAGPSVGNLGAFDQPNPDHMTVNRATAITGSLSARYRTSSRSTFSLNTGISYQYPFREENRLDVNNPGLGYEYAFRWGDVQMLTGPSAALTTSKNARSVGERASAGYSIAAVKNLGESRFSVGLDTRLSYIFYDRPYQMPSVDTSAPPPPGFRRRIAAAANRPASVGDGRVTLANASLNPSLKYRWTDYLEMNTGLSFSFFHPRYVPASEASIQRRTLAQSFGVAYAYSREIYFSPYVQFYPTQFTWRDTSVNVSAIFSVL